MIGSDKVIRIRHVNSRVTVQRVDVVTERLRHFLFFAG